MNITVLGAGAGGLATAFDCAQHGHQVRLFDFAAFPENIAAVAAEGRITAEGDLSGEVKIAYAGHDVDEAMRDAELVYVVGPAYSTEPFGRALAGKLVPGQTVVVTPGSCGGALAFKRAAGLSIDDETVFVAETSTLHYAVRVVGPARLRVFLKLKAGNLMAALPQSRTPAILELVSDVYPNTEPVESVLQTSLQNANPIIHPAVTLCNAARIEMTGGDFLFYEDGVSDGVGRLIEALDQERIAIGRKLGLRIEPDPVMGMRQGYMRENNYGASYRDAPGFQGIGAQPRLDHRYLNEDVGYGLVFMSTLARQLAVPVPTMDAVIAIASTVMARDYRGEGLRTPSTLGIDACSTEDLARL